MSGRSDDYIADLTRWIREISACAVSDPPYSYVHHHWISRRLLGDEDGWSIECAQCGRPYPSPFRSPGHGDRDYRELMMILRIANTVESWLPRASEADEETANQANQADRDKSDALRARAAIKESTVLDAARRWALARRAHEVACQHANRAHEDVMDEIERRQSENYVRPADALDLGRELLRHKDQVLEIVNQAYQEALLAMEALREAALAL